MNLILAAAAVICGAGWLTTRISTKALVLYMLGKGYEMPTKEETKACCNAAIQEMFRLQS